MLGNELTDNFLKDKFPKSDVPAPEPEKVLDIHEFDELIDDYQESQRGGTSQVRTAARRALKDAYRAALRAAGLNDQ